MDLPLPRRGGDHSAASLDRIIKDVDVLFLVTDTRESRWLPSVLGAFHRKALKISYDRLF